MSISAVSPRVAPAPRPRVELPRDEGSHPDAKTEWWYLNGHLQDEQGRQYGFMYALFDAPDVIDGRYNVDLPGMPGAAALDTALIEQDSGRHSRSRTLQLRLPGSRFPGVRTGELDHRFRNENGEWHLKRFDQQRITVQGPLGRAQVDLQMDSLKPTLLMGGEGEIAMGPHGLSKYYTFPRMETHGTLTVDGETRKVHGTAWLDHQWGDMQMYNGYQGWDWFGIQLDDGTDVNAFRFRGDDGGNVGASVGISRPDGTQAVSEDLRLTPGREWQSPETGASYPMEWHVVVADQGIDLQVKARHDAQEMVGHPPHCEPRLAAMPTYWEGPVEVSGTVQGKPVTGRAYMELTGYPGTGIFSEPGVLAPETVDLARRLGSGEPPA